MMAVFVNFIFSNTVFTHTHNDVTDGTVTHSHPYLPSSGHGHTHNSFDQIAGFNAAVAAFQGTAVLELSAPETQAYSIECLYKPTSFVARENLISLRAPPVYC